MATLPDRDIFKAYDIRGLYGTELDAEVAGLIGRAFVRVIAELGGKAPSDLRLGLGRDMRLTAPEMAAAYRDGIAAEGATGSTRGWSPRRCFISSSGPANSPAA